MALAILDREKIFCMNCNLFSGQVGKVFDVMPSYEGNLMDFAREKKSVYLGSSTWRLEKEKCR